MIAAAPAATGLTILDAMGDAAIFGSHGAFADPASWSTWRTFLGAVYGLPLTPAEVALFSRFTGRARYSPPPGGYRQVALISGRQSGKSRASALIMAFEAALSAPSPDRGMVYAIGVAQDFRGAQRVLYSYTASLIEESPVLSSMVTGRTADTLTLENGHAISCYPCVSASVRGLRARVVVLDEVAYFRGSDSRLLDRDMVRSVRPCLATTGGRLILLSSPYGQSGVLWDMYRNHYAKDDSPILIWKAGAPDMNPSLPASYIKAMREEDPEGSRAEIDGEFLAGISSLFDGRALDECVIPGRGELLPAESINYFAFTDPSGGSKDKFTLAVSHREGERVVIDLVRAWKPPFNPSGVVEEIAEVLSPYHVHTVHGDNYAGEWPKEQFRANGLQYERSTADRSTLYLEMLPVINAGTVELLDHAESLRELRGLERRRGSSGRDRVDHPRGAHDDLANSIAGAAWLAKKRGGGFRVW